jgi:hypothetical protein
VTPFVAVLAAMIYFSSMSNNQRRATNPDPAGTNNSEIIINQQNLNPKNAGDTLAYRRRERQLKEYGNIGNTSDGIRVEELIAKNATADVKPTQAQNTEGDNTNNSGNSLPQDHHIENFRPITSPSELEIHKIELIKKFIYLSTGIKQDYDLFIFEGEGALGVNIPGKGGIGLHRKMLTVPFEQALGTICHELSHEKPEGNYAHGDVRFYKALTAFLTKTVDKLLRISNTPHSRRTNEDNELLDIANQWNELIVPPDPARALLK